MMTHENESFADVEQYFHVMSLSWRLRRRLIYSPVYSPHLNNNILLMKSP